MTVLIHHPLAGLLNGDLDTRSLDLNSPRALPCRSLQTARTTSPSRPTARDPTGSPPPEPPDTRQPAPAAVPRPRPAAAGHAALQLRHGAPPAQSAHRPLEQARLCPVRERRLVPGGRAV
jgi:hypothetical protein